MYFIEKHRKILNPMTCVRFFFDFSLMTCYLQIICKRSISRFILIYICKLLNSDKKVSVVFCTFENWFCFIFLSRLKSNRKSRYCRQHCSIVHAKCTKYTHTYYNGPKLQKYLELQMLRQNLKLYEKCNIFPPRTGP